MYTTLAVERVDARDHPGGAPESGRGEWHLIALNVGALGENAVERYALFLVLFKLGKDEGIRIEGVDGGDLIEEWRRALLRARERGQDVSRVAVVAAERFVDKAFEFLPPTSTKGRFHLLLVPNRTTLVRLSVSTMPGG
ncbi:hypothetical protein F5887DRAFT_916111 [Amanita rubescens]|nr:hypothetical protein F5887DRAFT_916111 [Amanita rubescens]